MKRLLASGIISVVLVALVAGCNGSGTSASMADAANAPSAQMEAALRNLGDDPPIRVLIVSSIPSMSVASSTPWRIESLDGKLLTVLAADTPTSITVRDGRLHLSILPDNPGVSGLVMESEPAGGALAIRKVPYGVGWWWQSNEDRAYEGRFSIYPKADGNLEVVVALTMEEYLRGVVPSEIGATSPHEALCAQAIAARSEALLALITRKYAGEHYDICSDVECQAFSGTQKRTAQSDTGVRATRGLALFFEGKPISAYYASCCGGHTEDIRNVWPDRAGEKSYWGMATYDGLGKSEYDLTREEDLRRWVDASPDVFCNPQRSKVPDWASRNFRWKREFTAEELSEFIAKKKDIGRLTAIKTLKRGPSGRLLEAEFIGEKGTLTLAPELTIRQIVHPPLRSAAFVVDTEGPAGRPDRFIIRGAGWGHGVGMCQTGAIAMANGGKSFREILAHYYSTATVEKAY